MSNLQKILAIILALGAIGGAVYRFDICKVAKADFQHYVASTENFKLESYRRYVQQKIWAMEQRYPTTYHQMPEYKQLVEELRQIDVKINAYYQTKSK